MIENNYAIRYSFLSVVNQSNFEELKKKGAIEVAMKGIPFNGSYEDFERRKAEFFSSTRLDVDAQQTFGLLSHAIPPDSYAAAKDCIDKVTTEGGVRVAYIINTKDTTAIRVRFNPGRVTGATVEVSVSGGRIMRDGRVATTVRTKCAQTCDIPLEIRRAVLHGGKYDTIAITTRAHPFADDPLVIPPLLTISSEDTFINGQVQSSAYGGWGVGGHEGKGNVVCVAATNGSIIVFDGNQPIWRPNYNRRSEGGGTPHEKTAMRLEPNPTPRQACAACWVYPIDADKEVYCDGTLEVMQRSFRKSEELPFTALSTPSLNDLVGRIRPLFGGEVSSFEMITEP
jgi:hypothetical protein